MHDADDAPANAATKLIAALEAEGAADADSEGRFRLDVARARDKLREYQLSEPERYICLLVEVSVLVGAKLIQFTTGEGELQARFWGQTFHPRELEDLGNALFVDLGGDRVEARERRRRRALQLLALAVPAALRAGAREIELWSAGASDRLLVQRGDDDDNDADSERWVFEAFPDASAQPEGGGTRVSLRFPTSIWGGELPGVTTLRERCRLSHHRIYLDGEPVPAGPSAVFVSEDGPAPATEPMEVLDTEGQAIGLATITTTTTDGHGWVHLLTNGWLVERLQLPGGAPGLIAVVELDLRRDLAQAKILRDAHLEATLEAVRRTQMSLAERAPAAVMVEAGPDRAMTPSLLSGVIRGPAVLVAAVFVCKLLYQWIPGVGIAASIVVAFASAYLLRDARVRRAFGRDWGVGD